MAAEVEIPTENARLEAFGAERPCPLRTPRSASSRRPGAI